MKKAIIIMVVSVTMVFFLTSLSIFAGAMEYGDNIVSDHYYADLIFGDVNSDGRLDIRDVVRIKKAAAGLDTEINMQAIGKTDSDTITSDDLAMLTLLLIYN